MKQITELNDPKRQLKNKDAHFAVPVLEHGDFSLGQTPAILAYIGPIIGMAPNDEKGRAKVNQIHLTVADLVNEAHDSHHPISVNLYYEDQKEESLSRAKDFVDTRIPKFMNYFDRQIIVNGHEPWLYGNSMTYADTSLFQVVDGLLYAYPKSMNEIKDQTPNVYKLYEAVKNHEKLKKYLASNRRQKYSMGLFRHYPELDVPKSERPVGKEKVIKASKSGSETKKATTIKGDKTRGTKRKAKDEASFKEDSNEIKTPLKKKTKRGK